MSAIIVYVKYTCQRKIKILSNNFHLASLFSVIMLPSPLYPILLISTVLTESLVSANKAEDPLGTPEGYLKYDIKKGASFNPEVLTNQRQVLGSRDHH